MEQRNQSRGRQSDERAKAKWIEHLKRLAQQPASHQAKLVAAWNATELPKDDAYFGEWLTKSLKSGLAEAVTDRSNIEDPELRAQVERMDKTWRTLKDIDRGADPNSPFNIAPKRLEEERQKYESLGIKPPSYESSKPTWNELQADKQRKAEATAKEQAAQREAEEKELLFSPDELKPAVGLDKAGAKSFKPMLLDEPTAAKPSSRDAAIRKAIEANGGHEKGSVDDVDRIRDSLYFNEDARVDGVPPKHADIRAVMEQMKVEAGQKFEKSAAGKRAADPRYADPMAIERERPSSASLTDHDSALVDLQDAHERLERAKQDKANDHTLKLEAPGSDRHNLASAAHDKAIADAEKAKGRAFNKFVPHAERVAGNRAEESANKPAAASVSHDTASRVAKLADIYDQQAKKGEGGSGLAVGAEFINDRWKADSMRGMLRDVQSGMSIDEAEQKWKGEARKWIATHNARRPKDTNWARWDGAADSTLETAARIASTRASIEARASRASRQRECEAVARQDVRCERNGLSIATSKQSSTRSQSMPM